MGVNQLEPQNRSVEAEPVMPESSRYAGQQVDDSSRRSIQIESAGAAKIASTDSQVELKNFYHEGRFWRAVVPLDHVEEIYGQVFNFSKVKTKPGPQGRVVVFDKRGLPKRTLPILNHVQSRFRLKSPHTIDLFPLEADCTGEPAHRLDDFIYTAEAVGPRGIVFNLRDALMGNLLNAHRFLSTREMVFERVVEENQYVTESASLPLDEDQKRRVLIESILRSHRAGMSEPYYLFRLFGTNNCTSIPFQILDGILDYTFWQRIGSLLYRLPMSPRFYLWVRGLDRDPSVRKLLRHEFEAFIHDPATQERKRARAENPAQYK